MNSAVLIRQARPLTSLRCGPLQGDFLVPFSPLHYIYATLGFLRIGPDHLEWPSTRAACPSLGHPWYSIYPWNCSLLLWLGWERLWLGIVCGCCVKGFDGFIDLLMQFVALCRMISLHSMLLLTVEISGLHRSYWTPVAMSTRRPRSVSFTLEDQRWFD